MTKKKSRGGLIFIIAIAGIATAVSGAGRDRIDQDGWQFFATANRCVGCGRFDFVRIIVSRRDFQLNFSRRLFAKVLNLDVDK